MKIEIRHDTGAGTKVYVRVYLTINGSDHVLDFGRETGCTVGKDLLADTLTARLSDEIERVRKWEYERGYRDGRGKRGKRSWFYTTFYTP